MPCICFSVFPFMATSAHKLWHLARVVFPIDESLVMVDALPSQHLDSFSLVWKTWFPGKEWKRGYPIPSTGYIIIFSIDMAVNWGLPPIFRHTIFSAISAVCFGNALRCFGGTVRLWKPHRREQRRMGCFHGIFAFGLTLVFFPWKVPLVFWGLGCISRFLWRNTDELVGYGFTRLGWRKAPQVTKELVTGIWGWPGLAGLAVKSRFWPKLL